jgi:hypothetical protein
MLTMNMIFRPIPTSPELGVMLTADPIGTGVDGDGVGLAVIDGEGEGGGGEYSRDADIDGDDVSDGDGVLDCVSDSVTVAVGKTDAV